jgi:hypothetical protein
MNTETPRKCAPKRLPSRGPTTSWTPGEPVSRGPTASTSRCLRSRSGVTPDPVKRNIRVTGGGRQAKRQDGFRARPEAGSTREIPAGGREIQVLPGLARHLHAGLPSRSSLLGETPAAPGSGSDLRLGPTSPATVGSEGPARTGLRAGAESRLRLRERRDPTVRRRLSTRRTWGPRRRGSGSREAARSAPRGGGRPAREAVTSVQPNERVGEPREGGGLVPKLPRGFSVFIGRVPPLPSPVPHRDDRRSACPRRVRPARSSPRPSAAAPV